MIVMGFDVAERKHPPGPGADLLGQGRLGGTSPAESTEKQGRSLGPMAFHGYPWTVVGYFHPLHPCLSALDSTIGGVCEASSRPVELPMGPEWVIEIGLRCCFSCLEGLAHRVRPDIQSYLSPYKLCYHGLNVGASRTRYCLSTSRRPPSR